MKKCIIFLAGFALLLAGCPRVTDKSGSTGTGKKYTVNFSAGANGTLSAKIKDGAGFTTGNQVPENTVLEFTATPKEGYKVERWEGAAADKTDNKKASLKVTKDVTVKVIFSKAAPPPPEPKKYTVNFSAGANGTLSAKIKDGAGFTTGNQVPENTVLEFTAVPNSGYKAEAWEGATVDAADNTKATLKVTKDSTVKVIFVKKNTTPAPQPPTPPAPPPAGEEYTVNFSAGENGTISAKIQGQTGTFSSGNKVAKGRILEFIASPASGYKVEAWEGVTVNPADSTQATLTVTKDSTVTVTFKEKPVMVTFTAGSNGTLKAEVDGTAISTGTLKDKGKTVTFTAAPDNGYRVKSWEINGGTFETGGQAGNAGATVTLSADTDVTVTFEYTGVYTLDNVTFTMKPIQAVTGITLKDGHTVSLSGYAIGETEVTNQLYNKVLKTGDGDNKPESGKTWFDCIVFCNKLTEQIYGKSECVYYSDETHTAVYTEANKGNKPFINMQKKGFRLPTEAEWMYAAKGGQNGLFAGSTKVQLDGIAWYRGNSGGDKHDVKTKTPNGYGLYDMCGNILEWCWNDSESTDAESLSGQDPSGKDETYVNTRILKGGSYGYPYNSSTEPENTPLNLMNKVGLPAGSPHATYGFRIVSRPF